MLHLVLGFIVTGIIIYSSITFERSISFEDDCGTEVTTHHVVFGKGSLAFIVGEYRLDRRVKLASFIIPPPRHYRLEYQLT